MNNSEEYFDALYAIVWDRDYPSEDYSLLLRYLYNTEFVYFMEMDSNRAAHGLALRRELGYDSDEPCSILEMMAALARTMENIMYDIDYGDRTSKWFWGMIDSLELYDQDDQNYDEEYVDYVINTFLYRKYSYDGRGGLFTVKNTDRDMRQLDIWYQMHRYLISIDENL